MKKKYIIAVLVFLPIITLLIVFHFSYDPNRSKNGFERRYITNLARQLTISILPIELHSFSGWNRNDVFISTLNPNEIVDYNLQDKSYKIYHVQMKLTKDALTFVDSTEIFILDGIHPQIYKTTIGGNVIDSSPIENSLCTRAVMTANNKFIIRQLVNGVKNQTFCLYDMQQNRFKNVSTISPNYNDGGVITDGILDFDKTTGRVTYVYYHMGGFECFDTALAPFYKGMTVDTMRHFKNTPIKYKGKDAITYLTSAQPPVIVNRASCSDNGLLFIYSKIRADNDNESKFSNNVPIDVYDLQNGHYKFSFYIPLIEHEKVNALSVLGKKMIVLYKDRIGVFNLSI